MESSSRSPAFEMNGKDKRYGLSEEVSFQYYWFLKFCKVWDDRIVAGSRFHDAGPVTANARSPKLSSNVEHGVLPSGVENEQCLQRYDRQSLLSSPLYIELSAAKLIKTAENVAYERT